MGTPFPEAIEGDDGNVPRSARGRKTAGGGTPAIPLGGSDRPGPVGDHEKCSEPITKSAEPAQIIGGSFSLSS